MCCARALGMPPRYLSVSMPCASGEKAAAGTDVRERGEQALRLGPAVEH